MSSEEIIERLLGEGIINAQQAEQLRSARQVNPGQAAQTSPAASFWPGFIIGVLLLAGLLVWGIFSVPEPAVVEDISQTLNNVGSAGAMNRNLAMGLSIGLFMMIPVLGVTWLYNSIVTREEQTFAGWAQIETAYQRRTELIPALIETVVKYARHEQDTLGQVTESRASGDNGIDLERLLETQQQTLRLLRSQQGQAPVDESILAELSTAQDRLSQQMLRILAVAESYPQLRASDQFLELQAQFEDSENRILAARNRFNQAVEAYNGAIRRLPGSMIAALGNFQRKAYFRADPGSQKPPARNWD